MSISDDEIYYLELKNMLAAKEVHTHFQPIVSLTDGHVIGYEALSRGKIGSILENPDTMFEIAHKYNMTWELELLCRIKAVNNAQTMPSEKKLFLNVDPGVIKDENFKRGFTQDFLLNNNIDPNNIIFEITEKTAIEDYKTFRMLLENYVEQGYKIAIDDTGAGYSGLKLLAETHPQYIKIDMDLIRNIDKDSFKQSLLISFLDFSQVTNMKIIAEGIETLDELNTLINIGIPYGQGFYLHKPCKKFAELPQSLKEHIANANRRKSSKYFNNSETEIVGNIIRYDSSILPDTLCKDVKEKFEDDNLQGIAVVNKNQEPLGLIMKSKFNERLATQYGVAIYMNRPIKLLMDKNALIVDYNDSLSMVSRAAMARKEENIYDYIIITKDNKYCGITTVKRLLEQTTNIELIYARHLNPLTGLPGNILIEKKIKELIDSEGDFSVLYLDLNDFKAYNDIYGFESGDDILKHTAKIIEENLSDVPSRDRFLGHIGGDDFIVCLNSFQRTEEICSNIIKNFDEAITHYYNEKDLAKGFITAINRYGVLENFPLMSVSIAVITNKGGQFMNSHEISELAAQIKKKCKSMKKSCYINADKDISCNMTNI
ncbi:phytochrome-like protein cph2 [Oxobacter pfennigii]|uniref:Phytochrome-like protein cph2 n=1 Tax=Oxobacter pfennigii TaxID=36849 RepID=A0A0P8YGC1_9CLOT|nr:GGDEF domain-containing protein [Oxobacter pfennigii]KPU46077.1 phytochrome-like protein cph2 [Oxobacter pfennigii]